MIVHSKISDLDALARCYKKAFPHSLAAAFGTRYMRKILAWFLSTDRNFLFHLIDDSTNAVIGFCGGMVNDGIQHRGSASEMIQFAFNEGIFAFMRKPWLLVHQEMRSKYGLAFKNIKRKFQKAGPKKFYRAGEVHPFSGLVVIGIDPAYQNKGYAKVLLHEFERKSKEYGVDKIRLSVKSDNAQAIQAYQKSGWTISEHRGSSTSMHKAI
jgi:ribosomal protein S18 acetylase RimI-like enzyme